MSEWKEARAVRIEEVVILDPSRLHARMDAKRQLVVTLPDGKVHHNVRVAPAFPISRPNAFLYLFDEEGKELGLITDPHKVERESRALLLAQADQAYFMPRIQNVFRIDENMGIARWEVETDRGWSAFDVIARGESSHWYVGHNKIVVRDADGNRYLIEDITALDGRSRRLLDLYL